MDDYRMQILCPADVKFDPPYPPFYSHVKGLKGVFIDRNIIMFSAMGYYFTISQPGLAWMRLPPLAKNKIGALN